MSKIVEIKWHVADGYVRGDRPHYVEYDLEDLPEDFLELSEVEQYDILHDLIMEDDFWNHVGLSIDKVEIVDNDD